MKSGGGRASYRLDLVAQMAELRRQATNGDEEAKAKVLRLCNEGRLLCDWEHVDATNVVTLPKRRHGSGTRPQQLEAQITRATSPEERRQFELRRDQLERDEERRPKKKVAA